MNPLHNKIAVVAGATRGAGRGIACMLGEAGATVCCTGRSVRRKPATAKRPETIEETAEMVSARGGRGIWVQVDHTDEAQVQALFARVQQEQGRLDILVNDVWGGDELTEWGKPFWQLDQSKGRLMLERAVHAHILTSRYGAPLMLGQRQGLIVEITDGDEELNRLYRGNLFYDLAKISAMRLANAMAMELRDTGITAVALSPGFLRSEAMLDHFGVTEENWREAIKKDQYFAESETPFFIGRAVVALATDPYVQEKSGRSLATWNLAKEYGFHDVDGRQPDMGSVLIGEVDRRWQRLIVLIENKLREQNRQFEFEHVRSRLELRARPAGSNKPHWFLWPVMSHEMWFREPEDLAAAFVKRSEDFWLSTFRHQN